MIPSVRTHLSESLLSPTGDRELNVARSLWRVREGDRNFGCAGCDGCAGCAGCDGWNGWNGGSGWRDGRDVDDGIGMELKKADGCVLSGEVMKGGEQIVSMLRSDSGENKQLPSAARQ